MFFSFSSVRLYTAKKSCTITDFFLQSNRNPLSSKQLKISIFIAEMAYFVAKYIIFLKIMLFVIIISKSICILQSESITV